MKYRNGFVSNSSSSSFVIPLQYLNGLQIALIQNHIAEAPKYGIYDACDEDEWSISVGSATIEGYTWMDNFDMEQFLTLIGVDMDKVTMDRNG